jgi:hypothetical protein
MNIDSEEEARRKCIHEAKAFFYRWEEESDLESQAILNCVSDAIEEYYEEDEVEFIADFDLEDGEEN